MAFCRVKNTSEEREDREKATSERKGGEERMLYGSKNDLFLFYFHVCFDLTQTDVTIGYTFDLCVVLPIWAKKFKFY